jgi:hypothetical protein
MSNNKPGKARASQLLQHGLLRSSFVPEPAQRDLRELTR